MDIITTGKGKSVKKRKKQIIIFIVIVAIFIISFPIRFLFVRYFPFDHITGEVTVTVNGSPVSFSQEDTLSVYLNEAKVDSAYKIEDNKITFKTKGCEKGYCSFEFTTNINGEEVTQEFGYRIYNWWEIVRIEYIVDFDDTGDELVVSVDRTNTVRNQFGFVTSDDKRGI